MDKFFGMNRRLDADKIPDGFSPLAVNVDLDKIGTVRKRKGTDLLGTAGVPDSKVQSITEYVNPQGVSEVQIIRNGTIYRYDSTNDTYIQVGDGGQFPSLKQVQSVNYKGRVYYVTEDEALRWNAGDNVVTLVNNETPANQIKAACVATAQQTLFIGNVTINSVNYPRRFYYSYFDSDTITETDQFWKTEETGFSDSTSFYDLQGGAIQAMIGYSARNQAYIFTDTKCYQFDITQAYTAPQNAIQEIFSIGCAGPKAVTVCDGVLYWMDKQAKMWAWRGSSSLPTELSYIIDDNGLGDSIISSIDKSAENLKKVCVFGIGKRVYFSVGLINVDNQALNNACVKISLSKDGLDGYFSVDTYPNRIVCASVGTVGSIQTLLVGDSTNVLKMNSQYHDTDTNALSTAINSYYRTKNLHFNYPFQEKKIQNIIVKYRPVDTEDTYLSLKVTTDGNTEYISISDSPSGVTNKGVINMYSSNSIFQKQAIKKAKLTQNMTGQTIGFELGNNQIDQSYEISMFGFDKYEIQASNIPIKSV